MELSPYYGYTSIITVVVDAIPKQSEERTQHSVESDPLSVYSTTLIDSRAPQLSADNTKYAEASPGINKSHIYPQC